jgi:hypothetical protein
MCFKTVYGPPLLQNKQQTVCKQFTTAQVEHVPSNDDEICELFHLTRDRSVILSENNIFIVKIYTNA